MGKINGFHVILLMILPCFMFLNKITRLVLLGEIGLNMLLVILHPVALYLKLTTIDHLSNKYLDMGNGEKLENKMIALKKCRREK